MSWVGRKLIIKKDGVAIAGARAKSVRINNESIDVTHEEEDGFRHLLDVVDTREIVLGIEGVLSLPHVGQLIQPKIAGELIDVDVEFPDGYLIQSDGAYIQNLQITGEHRNAVMFSASLVISGPWTLPVAPATDVGRLWGWGTNGFNQLQFELDGGDPPAPILSSRAPLRCDLIEEDWSQAICVDGATLAIRAGRLYAWGLNSVSGITGLGLTSGTTDTPTQVGEFDDWEMISGIATHVLGIRAGRLYAWGSALNGKLGNGTTSPAVTTPTQIGAREDWTWVSAGAAYSLGIAGGRLYGWGLNASGRNGLGLTTGDTLVPAAVGDFDDWVRCHACTAHSLGTRTDDLILHSWGWNSFGRTGLGTTSGNQLTPAALGGTSGVEEFRAGAKGSHFIMDGILYGCGSNSNGEVGFGEGIYNQTSFQQIGDLDDWQKIAVGNTGPVTFGIAGGRLYGWGENDLNHPIGNGDTGRVWLPTQISEAEDWIKIFDTWGRHTLAIRAA